MNQETKKYTVYAVKVFNTYSVSTGLQINLLPPKFISQLTPNELANNRMRSITIYWLL